MNKIQVFTNSSGLAYAVANNFVEQAKHAIETKGRFAVALAGGSTPQKSYQLLASKAFSTQLDWSKVYIFWGDERCVHPDHEDSNYNMTRDALLKYIPIPITNIHRMEGELEPSKAAHRYEIEIRKFFCEKSRFDLILLGMGRDGHTASLFPGTDAIRKTDILVTANYVDKLSSWRITLTAAAINQAHSITFIVSGENKAETIEKVIQGEYQPDVYPSQLIKPVQGKLTWYLDKNAARLLDT